MTVYIETPRLSLRDWKPEDKAPFVRINSDPMIMEYFPRTLSEKDSERIFKRFQKQFKERGYGPYALELKKTGEFIGFCGLLDVPAEMVFAPAVEIAWRLDYEFWGKGYATEAAQAVITYAFDHLGLEEIVAYAVHDNTGAIRIMEKIGMSRDAGADFTYPGLAAEHPLGFFVLYRLKKESFRAHIA
jgi:RimJ/RimL family protein N-acetyltransferase